MQLLDAETLAVIKDTIKDVVDTFFKMPVTLNVRNPKQKAYGEGIDGQPTPHNFLAMVNFSVGADGRYMNVHHSETGQRLRDGYRAYFWKDEIDAANVVVDPERDTITIAGKEYRMKMWAPSALFSTLGFLLYECEIKYEGE